MLADIELLLYDLHLKITRGLTENQFIRWLHFDRRVHETTTKLKQKLKRTHNGKLNALVLSRAPPVKLTPEFVPNFVINESNETFSEEEMNLFNKGLKFTSKPVKLNTLESVVDIETILEYDLPSVQIDIRNVAASVIDSAKQRKHTHLIWQNNK